MKKIAIFQTDLNYGGIQKSLVNLLNNIDYKKYEVDLYLFNKDNVFIDEISSKVNIIYLKKITYFSRVIFFEILNKFYKNKIDKEYDLAIDFNSYSMDTVLSCIKCKSKRKVMWVHNDIKIKLKEEILYFILHFFFKAKYKYFDEFIAVSKGALDSFKEYHKFEDKKYRVIPNMIDTKEIYDLVKEKSNIKIDSKKYNLCSVGRLTHQKGFDILLDDIYELTKIKTNFHLYIIGDGSSRKVLEKKINCLQLNEYVTLLGYQKNVFSIEDEMDGFVLTSRYEGQGMVFLEAKALGLDIIMPKHLEKYVEGIKGTDNVVKSLSELKRHKKKYNDLKKYNDDIIYEIDDLFNG